MTWLRVTTACDQCHREVRPDELTEVIVDDIQVLFCSAKCAFAGGRQLALDWAADAISRMPRLAEVNIESGARSEQHEKGSTEGGAL